MILSVGSLKNATSRMPWRGLNIRIRKVIIPKWSQNFHTSRACYSLGDIQSPATVRNQHGDQPIENRSDARHGGVQTKRRWTAADEELLYQMREDECSLSEMCTALHRTERAITTKTFRFHSPVYDRLILEAVREGLSWQQLKKQIPLLSMRQIKQRHNTLQAGEQAKTRKLKRSFSQEESEQLVKLPQQGMSWPEMEEVMGRDRSSLRERYVKLVPDSSARVKDRSRQWWSERDVEKLREMDRQGRTNAEIGSMLNKTPASVGKKRERMRSVGVYRRVKKWTTREDDHLLELVASGQKTRVEIGRIMDRSLDAVNGRLRNMRTLKQTVGTRLY